MEGWTWHQVINIQVRGRALVKILVALGAFAIPLPPHYRPQRPVVAGMPHEENFLVLCVQRKAEAVQDLWCQKMSNSLDGSLRLWILGVLAIPANWHILAVVTM